MHPITLEPTPGRVVVRVGGRVVADSTSAMTLREAAYSPVQYIPLADVDQSVLRPSSHQTYCPYKGEASYYSLAVKHPDSGEVEEIADAVWTYTDPYDAVDRIASHVAFYPDRVEVTVE
ncbi:hypothetical protein GCM10017788_32330 [Amycolatopsis acidiphila]|nr:hypothetical protein GCM10017788_32330 [Amycolatopsis acidiphila]